MSAGIKMVGANGFEPSTSWSRTRHLNPINALFGVAYGTRSVISPLSVVPNLYLEFEVTPVVRGDSCAHLHHYFRVARNPSTIADWTSAESRENATRLGWTALPL